MSVTVLPWIVMLILGATIPFLDVIEDKFASWLFDVPYEELRDERAKRMERRRRRN